MVRTALAPEYISTYITTIEKSADVKIGLLFGQSCSGKDYIVHACVTPTCREGDEEPTKNPQKKKAKTQTINDINDNWVAEHARHATRMLPGGMHVIGIFVISEEGLLSPFNPKLKSILLKLHQQLNTAKYLYGNLDSEKIVLNYCTKLHQFVCKSFEANASYAQPADFKLLNTALKWQNLECKFDVDFVYHIKQNENGWNLKKHMSIILDNISNNLHNAIILYNGESREADECLENVGKKKVLRKSVPTHKEPQDEIKAIQVSIFELCNKEINSKSDYVLYEASGQIRITGQIASKVWLNPKITIKTASDAVMQDIMRSLATRMEMHLDSLTEEEHSEEVNTIHEPPRRVFIPLADNEITVSDYLFPGESLPELVTSLQELLGIKSVGLEDVQDIEGQANLTHYTDALESESEVVLPKLSTDTNKFMYLIGLGVALFVLILSLLIHFIKQ